MKKKNVVNKENLWKYYLQFDQKRHDQNSQAYIL